MAIMYYELREDGTIGAFTPNQKVAVANNLTLQTERNIDYGYDGRAYFEGEEPARPQPSYAELRAAEYPPVPEQLDMLYWDKVNNTNDWQNEIARIKNKYPKPPEEVTPIPEPEEEIGE